MVSTVTRFPRFCGVNGFIVSCVSWFHRFSGVNGFMCFVVSMVTCVNGFMLS